MVLGTSDEDGVPWVTPVWFAQADHRRFIWVSSPERRHSRNVRARPEVSIVVFDSRVAVGSARAVYMSASARELSGADLERDVAFFDTAARHRALPAAGRWRTCSLRRRIGSIGRRCRSIGSSIQRAVPTTAPRSRSKGNPSAERTTCPWDRQVAHCRIAPSTERHHRAGLTGHVDRRSARRRRRRAGVSRTVPLRNGLGADCVILCREAPAGSAHQMSGLDRLGSDANRSRRISCRPYDVSTMSASPSRTSTR